MDDARRRLDAADRLLREPDLNNDEGVWPRACTWLIRLAVEHALDDYWATTRPEVAGASRHAQLLALTRFADADLGQRATALWHALSLSRVAHHHAYELAPTAAELRTWHHEAIQLASGRSTGPLPVLRQGVRHAQPDRHERTRRLPRAICTGHLAQWASRHGRPPVIIGAHTVLFAQDPDRARAFLRDVLGLQHVDAGGGWLVFRSPPAELAVHPADAAGSGRHELYLLCDDVAVTAERLAAHGVLCAPTHEERWGLVTSFELPGAGPVGLYQPRHPTAFDRPS